MLVCVYECVLCVHVCNRSRRVRREGSAKGLGVGEVMRLQNLLQGAGNPGSCLDSETRGFLVEVTLKVK